jgi:hypothetical protein
MISIGGYTFGVDDKCALFLRINDWQDDLAKHAPPPGGFRDKIPKHPKAEHIPGRKPGRPRKTAATPLETVPEGMATINELATA